MCYISVLFSSAFDKDPVITTVNGELEYREDDHAKLTCECEDAVEFRFWKYGYYRGSWSRENTKEIYTYPGWYGCTAKSSDGSLRNSIPISLSRSKFFFLILAFVMVYIEYKYINV